MHGAVNRPQSGAVARLPRRRTPQPDSEARRETPHPSVDVEVGYPQKPPLQVSLESEQEKPAQQRCPFPPQGLQKPPRHSALDVQELFPQQG
jgi:hypothetical protein